MHRYREHKTSTGVIVRSGLEVQVFEQLLEAGVKFEYESTKYNWREYNPRAICPKCGAKGCYQERQYLADFSLANGIIIESKGRLTARDRKLLTSVRECNPGTDFRVLFGRDNTLSRKSRTRYSEWAKKRNFKYCIGKIPKSWLS